jgi:hypothetical protein
MITDYIIRFINYCFNTVNILIFIHTIIYGLVATYSTTTNLFLNLLTINGTINAIRFVKTLYENKSQNLYEDNIKNGIIENDHVLHKLKIIIEKRFPNYVQHFNFPSDGYISIIQKHFLFLCLYITSVLANTILWSHLSYYIDNILLLFALPLFNVLVINSVAFTNLYDSIISKIKHIGIYSLSKIATNTINSITEITLDQKAQLDFRELMDFFDNYENAFMNTFIFLKTVAIQTFIYYIKNTKNIFYYYVIDIVHRYQTERLDFFTRTENLLTFDKQKDVLIKIITDRKWDELLKPKTVYMFFETYESKNDNNRFIIKIGMLIRNIMINLTRFMSLWYFASVAPIVGIIIDCYYTFFNKRFFIRQTLLPYLVGILTLYFYSFQLGSVFMVLSDLLLKPPLDYIDDHKVVSRYLFRTQYQMKYLLVLPVITLCSYLPFWYIVFAIPIVLYYINSDIYPNHTLFVVTLLGLLSNFNIVHLIMSWMILNTMNNIRHNNNNQDSGPALKLNLLEDYIQISEPVQLRKRKKLEESMLKVNTDNVNEKPTRYNICQMVTQMFRRG